MSTDDDKIGREVEVFLAWARKVVPEELYEAHKASVSFDWTSLYVPVEWRTYLIAPLPSVATRFGDPA